MLALEGHVEANGGSVVLQCPVERVERDAAGLFRLTTGGANPGAVTCRHLVISAGLHASKLARTLAFGDGYRPPETYYAKGQYYALSGRSPFKRHIYPLPDGGWLGLHATVDIGGRCKFGPDIAWIPDIDYGFEPEKLGNSSTSSAAIIRASRSSACTPITRASAPSSIAKASRCLISPSMGSASTGRTGLVALYGIESPGLTAALAIGEMVAGLLARRG